MDGVAEYFSESHVSGPDQLFCDHCAAKTDATMVSSDSLYYYICLYEVNLMISEW